MDKKALTITNNKTSRKEKNFVNKNKDNELALLNKELNPFLEVNENIPIEIQNILV